jgi:hypothetical protein
MPVDTNALARLGAQIRINELIAEIESLVEAFPGLGKAPARTSRAAESEAPAPRKRRRVSAATKAKLRASWARRRAGSSAAPETAATEQVASAEAPEKKRRTISAAGRARIAAAQKKRWAAVRMAKKKKA